MMDRRLFRTNRSTRPSRTLSILQQLRRVLGPLQLTLLGIGAIIGAGILRRSAPLRRETWRPGAGPALMVSFLVTAIVCGFTALCYAEFASIVPITGSAYTYAYMTMGEIVAWIIGWDLIIEYAVGNIAVAISWANYCKTFLKGFGVSCRIGCRWTIGRQQNRRCFWGTDCLSRCAASLGRCRSFAICSRFPLWRRLHCSSSGGYEKAHASMP